MYLIKLSQCINFRFIYNLKLHLKYKDKNFSYWCKAEITKGGNNGKEEDQEEEGREAQEVQEVT